MKQHTPERLKREEKNRESEETKGTATTDGLDEPKAEDAAFVSFEEIPAPEEEKEEL